MAGCSQSEQADVTFEVNPEYLGPTYETDEAEVSFRPPNGWMALSDDQRGRVADALLEAVTEPDRYSLELIDLFLETNTLCFASLSHVVWDGQPVTDLEAYADAVTAGLDATESAAVHGLSRSSADVHPGRRRFALGGISMARGCPFSQNPIAAASSVPSRRLAS